MSIRDYVSPEVIQAASNLTSWIKDGTIKKQVLPNTSCDFDEEKVFKNAEVLSESGVFDKIIADAYDRNK